MGTLIQDNDFTRILHWPGYRVYRHEIDERRKKLRLWVVYDKFHILQHAKRGHR